MNLHAVDDADAIDDTMTLTHAASSTDTGYSGLSTDYSVTLTDDDPAIVASTSVRIDEGTAYDHEVKLAAEPGASVVVTVASADTDKATVDTDPVTAGNQSTLTFTTANWNTAQTVELLGTDDADAGNETT